MKSFKRISGFTLIELLVVLLIIGTLSAFVIPMYQHAILESRFGILIPLAKSAANAQERYYMHTGRYASTQEALDVHYDQDDGKVNIVFGNTKEFAFTLASRTDVPNTYYVIYQQYSKNFPANVHCEAKKSDANAMWLCQEGFTGEPIEHASLLGSEYAAFLLSGDAATGWVPTVYQGSSNVDLAHGDSCETGTTGGCNGVSASDNSSCSVTGSEGGCNEGNFDGSTCSTQQGGGAGCQGGTFTNDSVCDSQTANSCSGSTFSSSSCYAAGGSNSCGAGSLFTNHSTCYGTSSANDRPHTSCGNSTYIDSTCYNTANQGYVCGASTYSNSSCYGNYYGGCGGNSTYTNGSVCYGDGATACDKSTFTSGSVCHANVKGACGKSTFRDGAYCTGEYCPVGTPKQDGTTWQPCPNAGNSGKTC